MADLIKSFKEKIKMIDEKEHVKIKVEEIYGEALKEKKLNKEFQKAGKLGEVVFPSCSIIIGVTDKFKGTLKKGEDAVEKYDGIISSSIITDDNVLEDIKSGNDKEYSLEVEEEPSICAYIKGKKKDGTYPLKHQSIAKAIFDIEGLRKLFGIEGDNLKEVEKMDVEEFLEEKPEEPEKPEESENAPKIKDSGNRKEFKSGAVRDVYDGKGRCDLLPLDIVSIFLEIKPELSFMGHIGKYQENSDIYDIIKAARAFSDETFGSPETGILEYSKHMEEGASKYGANNWRKGIPFERYLDSAVRHYLKFKRGDTDERHDRAVLWNLLCLAWTIEHAKELNL